MRQTVLCLLAAATICQAGEKPPYHRTFIGVSPEQVFSAQVRPTSTLGSHDRRACLVNLSVGQYFRGVEICRLPGGPRRG